MLLKIVCESLANSLLYGTCHLAVAKLGLGLSLELRFCHLDADDGCKSFAEVLTADFDMVLCQLLEFLGALCLGVSLERTCQRCAESLKVGTTLDGVDVVDV